MFFSINAEISNINIVFYCFPPGLYTLAWRGCRGRRRGRESSPGPALTGGGGAPAQRRPGRRGPGSCSASGCSYRASPGTSGLRSSHTGSRVRGTLWGLRGGGPTSPSPSLLNSQYWLTDPSSHLSHLPPPPASHFFYRLVTSVGVYEVTAVRSSPISLSLIGQIHRFILSFESAKLP